MGADSGDPRGGKPKTTRLIVVQTALITGLSIRRWGDRQVEVRERTQEPVVFTLSESKRATVSRLSSSIVIVYHLLWPNALKVNGLYVWSKIRIAGETSLDKRVGSLL